MKEKDFPLLIVLCGLPGSGKSTVASSLANRATADGFSVSVIHFDDALNDSCEGFDPKTWKESRICCMEKAAQDLRTKTIVILDDTMHYQSMRIQCWKMARRCNACYMQVYIECDFPTCCERNASRKEAARVPQDVMDRMRQVFEPPRVKSSRHPWDERTRVVHQHLTCIEEVWVDILGSWDAPAPPYQEAEIARAMRHSTHESWIHQLDISTRKILSESLSLVEKGSKKKLFAEKLNKERRMLLQSSRCAETCDQAMLDAHAHQFRLTCKDILRNSNTPM